MTRTRIPSVLVLSCAIAVPGGRALGGADDVAQLLRQIPGDLPLAFVATNLEKLDEAVTFLVKVIDPDTEYDGFFGKVYENVLLAEWIDFSKPVGFGQIIAEQKDSNLVWAVVPGFKDKVGAVEGAVEEEGVWKIPFEGKDDVYARTDGAFVVAARSKEFLARAKAEEGSLGDSAEWPLDVLPHRAVLVHIKVEPFRSTAEPLGKWAHAYAAMLASMVSQNRGTDPRVLTGFLTALFDAAEKFFNQLESIDLALGVDKQAIKATIATVYKKGPVKKYLANGKPATASFFTEIEAQPFIFALGYHVPREESTFFDYVCDIVKKSAVAVKGTAATPPADGAATAESLRKATEITRGFLRRLEGMNMVMTGSPDGLIISGDYVGKDAGAILDAARKVTVTPGSFLRPFSPEASYQSLGSRQVGGVTVEGFGLKGDQSESEQLPTARLFGAVPRRGLALIGGRVRHYKGDAKSLEAAFASEVTESLASMPTVREALAALPPSSNAVLLIEPIAGLGMYMQALGQSQAGTATPIPPIAISASLAGESARIDVHVPILTIRVAKMIMPRPKANASPGGAG